jgi:hypothetical protein
LRSSSTTRTSGCVSAPAFDCGKSRPTCEARREHRDVASDQRNLKRVSLRLSRDWREWPIRWLNRPKGELAYSVPKSEPRRRCPGSALPAGFRFVMRRTSPATSAGWRSSSTGAPISSPWPPQRGNRPAEAHHRIACDRPWMPTFRRGL